MNGADLGVAAVVVFALPLVIALLGEVWFLARTGILREHPRRVAVAFLATILGGVLVSLPLAQALPSDATLFEFESFGRHFMVSPLGWISVIFAACPAAWWANSVRKDT